MKTINLPVSFIVILLLTLCPAIAGDHSDEPDLIAALSLIKSGDFMKAEQTLTLLTRNNPEQADAYLLQGITRYHLKKYTACVTDLNRAIQFKTTHTSRALYYMGMAWSQLDKAKEAEACFDRIINEFPNSAEAKKIGVRPRTESRLEKPAQKPVKRWQVLLMQDVGFDSNPSRISGGEDDGYLLSFISGKCQTGTLPLYIKGSALHQHYVDSDDLNVTSAGGGLEGEVRLSPADLLRPEAVIEHLWISGDSLGTAYRLAATWEHQWKPQWQTDLSLRYAYKDYSGDEFEIIKGDHFEAALKSNYSFSRIPVLSNIHLFGGYFRDTADEDYLSYHGGRAAIDIGLELPFQIFQTLGFGYERRDYLDTDPGYDTTRKEDRMEIFVTFMRSIFKQVFVSLGGNLLKNESTIDDYDFTQWTVHGGLILIF